MAMAAMMAMIATTTISSTRVTPRWSRRSRFMPAVLAPTRLASFRSRPVPASAAVPRIEGAEAPAAPVTSAPSLRVTARPWLAGAGVVRGVGDLAVRRVGSPRRAGALEAAVEALDEVLQRALGRERAVVLAVVDRAGRAQGRDGALVGGEPGLLLHVLVERDGDGRDDGDDRDDDHQLDQRHTALVLQPTEHHEEPPPVRVGGPPARHPAERVPETSNG